MATLAQKQWIIRIHTAKNVLKLSDESYRAILAAANVASSTEISTWEQFDTVMACFKKLGFVSKKVDSEPRAKNMITKKQEYYIKGLWELASKNKTESSLRALIKRIADVDDIRFLSKANASKVILALREIAKAAGFNPDFKE